MWVQITTHIDNIYGWYFERNSECHKDPRIVFYSRYINYCLSIIYADSEDEALNVINKLKIGPCIIEWNSSQQSQLYLDMLLYVDHNNNLQYKPFHKARSHQERIPWVSHHPDDVKRGTLIGEISRLATLCSLESSYQESLESLATLYITCGYPMDKVTYWINKYKLEQWNKHLSEEVKEMKEVLVLKSQFTAVFSCLRNRSESFLDVAHIKKGKTRTSDAGLCDHYAFLHLKRFESLHPCPAP